MSLKRRIEDLEGRAEPPEDHKVVVRRRVVRQTPDGPLTLAVREVTIEAGERTVGPWLTLDGEPADV